MYRLAQRLSSVENESASRVQTLDKAVYISILVNAFCKGINLSVLSYS